VSTPTRKPSGRRHALHGEPATTFKRLVSLETDECVLWPFGQRPGGYGVIYLDGKQRAVHVLACERAHGPKPIGKEAAHSCGISACLNYRHLRWATHKENLADKLLHGTSNRGERHGLANLTVKDVRSIRKMATRGEFSTGEIADRFNVSRGAISDVLARRTWGWLDPNDSFTPTFPPLRGTRHGRSILTARDVQNIRQLRADGLTYRMIADRLGFKPSLVADVVSRRSWGWFK
jgi:hypothetical protein